MPADAPLEIEANISGNDDGYVQLGGPVTIKLDTFSFTRYGRHTARCAWSARTASILSMPVARDAMHEP